ncbi:PREDICTED: probable DNA-directed RNA polymerase [Theobroma cacao]|uniref:DNA-directed RNA polymerase n=1 Tax=Theobroma cacao TaxID=3641 RepID=A0AB32X0H6_THECC|nr:PREDICTED: probable DNA-directed RNA polymerase [Theobroma cacao]
MSDVHSATKSEQYKNEVFILLDKAKELFPLSEDLLRDLQMEIEDMTMLFDEQSMFKSVPNIIKILIRDYDVSAKDYLRGMELEKDDIELLSEFGQYTIEALIVHVLGMLFNPLENYSIIRVASLVERLEYSVRIQALLLKSRRCKKPFSMVKDEVEKVKFSGKERKRSKLVIMYPFGSGLVQFMEERGLITLTSDLIGTVRVQKKKGAYFLPSNLFALCNFDISLLPIKLNLPMVCPPLDWKSASQHGQEPRTLSDLSGGYLSGPTGEIYDRYRLLSTGDIYNFYIDIGRDNNYMYLCSVMNKLQRQPFQINSDWLKYIQINEDLFVEYGYLMPKFLSSMNIKNVSFLLREFYMKDEVINKICSFNELLQTLNKSIQRARYEQLIIKLAIAYEGYKFYLPAFLDFRGRIYRSGVLHFHERDLARSLIVFADCNSMESRKKDNVIAAAAFHYKPFKSVNNALLWYYENKLQIESNSLLFTLEAKRNFQFIANQIGIFTGKWNCLPIIQDASASAYQIMSYFLLDESLAKRTNLIPSPDGEMQDVYSFLLEELKEFMKAELANNLSTIVCDIIDRKIVKGIFMPIIYGKTLMSTANDLKVHLSHFITHKECYEIASVCFKFWRTKYQGIPCLIRLIRHIGWIVSARNSPVFYRVPFFTTVQDYMIMEPINIWVYDRLHKKRRRVTLRVSSSKRDRRKTEISTFVNFIHQKDAHIAMCVVEQMLSIGAPIYTVHDNFISTAQYSDLIPSIYSNVICNMDPPLSVINEFIYMNVIKPFVKGNSNKSSMARKEISKEMLHYYLKANVPENISKKMMATWEERISGILTSYDNYTRIVCGDLKSPNPMDLWIAHEKKWEKFKLKLRSGGKGIPNYCVHY